MKSVSQSQLTTRIGAAWSLFVFCLLSLSSCDSDLSYPARFDFEEVEILSTYTSTQSASGDVTEVVPTSIYFTDPGLIFEQLGSPFQVAAVTLLSESEIELESDQGQVVTLPYTMDGAQVVAQDFNMSIDDDNKAATVSGCLAVILIPNVALDACTRSCLPFDTAPDMEMLFQEYDLSPGDTLGYSYFESIYRRQ